MHLLTVSEKILFLLCGLGIVQGILLASLAYFHPKSDRSVNIFLALYIVATSVIMTIPFSLEVIGWQKNFPILCVPYLTGPLLYLYLRSFKEVITWRKWLPHFIPFVVFLFLTYWNVTTLGQKYPGHFKQPPPEILNRPTTILITLSKPVQQIIYYFLSRRTLSSYQRSIRHLFSETSRFDLNWAKFLNNGYLILVLSFVVIFPLMLRFPQYFDVLLLGNMVIATPYVYITTYKGIMQHTVWQAQPTSTREAVEKEIHQAEEIETEVKHAPKQAADKGLNAEKIDDLVRRITQLMEKDKLYQETELTLQQLAGKLEVPNYQVSLALNEGLKKNFYDVVNGYRVEEAKRLLLDADNRNYTVLSVGFEAGFNSKTTFNTVFKKFTGLTPTEFRNKEKMEAVLA